MLINSPNISGSLTVTGNSVISGSLNVLGSITGAITGSATTASYVEFANVADKPTLVSGSSQVTYSDLTGIPSGIVSGSAQVAGFGIFATTGSNQFNGSQAITGSLTVTGTIVAQTLNVQQVTSSVVFSSGSNVFGNSLSNTQQFTGSVFITGSLNTSITAFGSTATTFLTSDSGTIRSRTAAQTLSDIAALPLAGGTLTGTLNGTSAVFSGGATFFNGGNTFIFAENVLTSGNAGGAHIRNIISTAENPTYTFVGDTNTGMFTSGSDGLGFSTAGVQRLSIGSAGAATFSSSVTAGGNFLTPAGSGLAWSGDASRIMTPEDNVQGAKIATPGGFLVEASVSKFIGGNVGIGTTGPAQLLTIQNTSSNPYLSIIGGASATLGVLLGTTGNTVDGQIIYNNSTQHLAFVTALAERMRITCGGNVGIGTSSPAYKLDVNGDARFGDGNNFNPLIQFAGSGRVAASPGYSFVGDLDTGMFNPNLGNTLAFTTAGSERMRITSDGNTQFIFRNTSDEIMDLRISTETASPSKSKISLMWYGNETAAIKFRRGGDSTGGELEFWTQATGGSISQKMAILGSGNVGIGTTTPNTKLEVANGFIRVAGTEGDQLFFEGVRSGVSTTLRIYDNSSTIFYDSFNSMAFRANQNGGSNGSIFFNGGNVGINTTNTSARLDVRINADNTVRLVGGGGTTGGNMLLSKISDYSDNSPINLFWADHGNPARENNLVRIHSNETLSGGLPLRITAQGSLASPTCEALAVNHVGNVGIGCISPGVSLTMGGTDAIKVPVGTTAQRPSPSTGMIRFNSSCTELEFYNGSEWLFFEAKPVTQGYYADMLVIAGGGGGGGAEASNGFGGGGAGGGAGGYIASRIFINYTIQSFPITIGAGGAGGASHSQGTGSGCNGVQGGASCALDFIAIGGGFGGGDETGTGGGNGGSGGGVGGDDGNSCGKGVLGQGCIGGANNNRVGGGGGGAGFTGCTGFIGGGFGGNGRIWLNGSTFAGGGGGGAGAAIQTTQRGGTGGGGCGSSTNGTSGAFEPGGTATPGIANTGGGGGGAAAGRAQGGQNGGSGIVIIRYFGPQIGFGGTITSSGGYTTHTFTTSGTYCATYFV